MTNPAFRVLTLSFLSLMLAACGPSDDRSPEDSTPFAPAARTEGPAVQRSIESARGPAPADRQAWFGDLHVHTMYSFDAFIFGTTASPDDAYEFAKGGALRHPGGFDMKLKQPLDFYGVTDHGFYLGAFRAMTMKDSPLFDHELAAGLRNVDDERSRIEMFRSIIGFLRSDRRGELLDASVFRDAWEDIVAAANRHNDPGKFTTFIGYEFTASGDDFQNLHRNVIFRDDRAPLPFTRLDSENPEHLWAWMDEQRASGFESLAVPHNSNGSNGEMFKLLTFDGAPLDDAYADVRMRNEPLVEIVQIKGQSETHPLLSPNDEWADFEIMPYRIASRLPSEPRGSYARKALMDGIEMMAGGGFNPFRFGVIGSSDTHNASYAGYEENFWGKSGIREDEPHERGSVPLPEPGAAGSRYGDDYYTRFGVAGLAGVWAEENTRSSLFEAFRRKETFATSGPRIRVRLFAGYGLPDPDESDAIARAYELGVPMGGEIVSQAQEAPDFLIWAQRDPNGAPLQRIQIVKAVVRNGESTERLYDVACSDGGNVDPSTHRCPDNGASADVNDCSISTGAGAAELRTLWRDPDFDASEHAVYYARVLENPVCRWSTWDAVRVGVPPRDDISAVIQERAWTSPIWFAPAARE